MALNIPRSNRSSMQAQNGSAEKPYIGSPALAIFMSATSHRRHMPSTTEHSIAQTDDHASNEPTVTTSHPQWYYLSAISASLEGTEYAQPCYLPNIVIDGDQPSAPISQHQVVPSDTNTHNQDNFPSEHNFDVTYTRNQINADEEVPLDNKTAPPSPTAQRWVAEYAGHEAMLLSLPRNNSKHQHRREIAAIDELDLGKDSVSSHK